MNFGQTYIFFVLLLTSPFGIAADICEIKRIESPTLNNRGGKITFPGGMTYQVVGHEHGARERQSQMLETLTNPEIPDSAIVDRLHSSTLELSKSLEHFRQDTKYLTKFLATNPETVLWVEASQDFFLTYRAKLVKAVQLRKNSLSKIDSQLLLASASPIIYLDVLNKLPPSSEIKGVESIGDEIKRLWQMSDELRANSLSFSQIETTNPRAFKLALSFIDEWDEMLQMAKTSDLYNYDVAKIDIAIDRNKFAPQISDSLKKRLRAYLMDHISSLKRDEQNVQRMIQERKHSIFMVGLLHLQPTMILLKQKCVDEIEKVRRGVEK